MDFNSLLQTSWGFSIQLQWESWSPSSVIVRFRPVPTAMTKTEVEGPGVCPLADEKEETVNRDKERYGFSHIASFHGMISGTQGMGMVSRIFSRIASVDNLAASA